MKSRSHKQPHIELMRVKVKKERTIAIITGGTQGLGLAIA